MHKRIRRDYHYILTSHGLVVYLCFAFNVQRVHLSTEESPASWMVTLFGEVGGGVPEYLSSGEVFGLIL